MTRSHIMLAAAVVLILHILPAHAAPLAEQIEVAENVAAAVATADHCSVYELDEATAVQYLLAADIPDITAVPELQEAFNAKFASVTYAVEGLGDERACMTGRVFYGPDGSKAPGLLTQKN